MKKSYIVATTHPWNIRTFHQVISHYPGDWHLVTSPDDLTVRIVDNISPRFIFFPHWSSLVSHEILELAECVGFHETDLPFGRGGSPIQNLIARGIYDTQVSALRMTTDLDAGPLYLQRPLSLRGLAEEIYVRTAELIAEMIQEIATAEPEPSPQVGQATTFRRRTPAESEIVATELTTLDSLFDHIRMLDAAEYPPAFIRHGGWLLEFRRPARRAGFIEADVRIRRAEA